MGKLARSALLGAFTVGLFAVGAQAHQSHALMFFEFSGTHNKNDMITIPCEATDYLAGKDYNLDPGVASPMGNPTGVVIKYETNYGNLTEGDQIHFKLQNAKFSNSLTKCWLVFYEHNGVDTNGNGIGDTSHDVTSDGDTNDALIIAESIGTVQNTREITFRVTNNGTSYPSNGILYLACAESGEPPLADIDTYTPVTYDETYNPVIVLDDLYDKNEHNNICPNDIPKPENKVCLTVTANACCPNTDLQLPDLSITTPQCFIDVACQLALDMRPSLSIIDMYPKGLGDADCTNSISGLFACYDTSYEPGHVFVDVGPGPILESISCTDNDAADGTITIYNNKNGQVDDVIRFGVGGWSGQLQLSLYDVRIGANGAGTDGYACDNNDDYGTVYGAYAALDFRHDRVFLDTNGDDTSTTGSHISFRPGKVCTLRNPLVLTDGMFGPDNEWKDDIYMGVTGSDRLYWVKWGLTEELKIMKDGNTIFTVKLDENAKCTGWDCCYDNDGNAAYFKKWEPNGDEAYIPHLLNNNLTYVKVANNSCWDAEVYARVWDENGHFVDNVYLGIVPAHGGKIFWGNEIFSKAKSLNPDLGTGGGYGTFSAILTVGAPKRDVEFAAGDSRDGKGKMLPVYDLDGEFKYYRQVDFDHDAFEQ
ncbi:MAG: hypothetical protein D6831_01130 [Aquificota bacterium]|nr:MAG: hypothetical protein D6831_01130 [Aquificota bacterium]